MGIGIIPVSPIGRKNWPNQRGLALGSGRFLKLELGQDWLQVGNLLERMWAGRIIPIILDGGLEVPVRMSGLEPV